MEYIQFTDNRYGIVCPGKALTGQTHLLRIKGALYPDSNKINTHRFGYALVENLRKLWMIYDISDPGKKVSTIKHKLAVTQFFVNFSFRAFLYEKHAPCKGSIFGGKTFEEITKNYMYRVKCLETGLEQKLDPIEIELKLKKSISI
ncbi:hypothetical protein IPM19_02610 [bacterium]|nr:MAG: hypothetical protein IPM19_02610 [bacterium]